MPVALAFDVAPTAGSLPVAQSIPLSCGGLTPVAVEVYITRATSLSTITAGAMISAGFSDGTVTRVAAAMSEDAVLASLADTGINYNNTTKIIRVLNTTDETIDGEADFVSLAANALNISWTDLPGSAYRIFVKAYYGVRWLAKCGATAASTSLNGVINVSGIPFRPVAIVSISARAGFASTGANADMHFGFCAFNPDGSVQGQCGYTVREGDRNTPAVCISGIRSDSIGQRTTTTVEESRIEITQGYADGFDITTRGAGGFAFAFGWIALYTDGGRANAGAINFTEGGGGATGTNTAGDKVVPVDGTPGTVMLIGTGLSDKTTYHTTTPAANYSVGCATKDATGCAGYSAADAAVTSATHCITCNTTVARVPDDSGGTLWQATLVSLNAGSFTLNVPTGGGGDNYVGYLALEDRKSAPQRRKRARGGLRSLRAGQGHPIVQGHAASPTVPGRSTGERGGAPGRVTPGQAGHPLGGHAASPAHPVVGPKPVAGKATPGVRGHALGGRTTAVQRSNNWVRETTKYRLARLERIRREVLPEPDEAATPPVVMAVPAEARGSNAIAGSEAGDNALAGSNRGS